jgi:hypothetical protein
MPYKSQAQAAYFNANRAKLESEGVDVDEWNASSKGMKLPAHKAKSVIDKAMHLHAKGHITTKAHNHIISRVKKS